MSIPMTQIGYSKLQKEIKELEAQRPIIKKQIEEARERGDLRENAEYHAAREALGMLEAKLSLMASKLAEASVVDEKDLPEGKACLGRRVTIKRLKDGKEFVRTLCGEGEADPANGRIHCTSPIGEAVVGHEVGDLVTANLPAGPVEFEIISIE